MNIVVRDLGSVDYGDCWLAMKDFTASRDGLSDDELWIVQHPAVFTLGRAGKREHLLAPRDIPVIETDRGGQVTYHGPGQLVVYTLINVHRIGLGPRELVKRIELGVIAYLAGHGLKAERRPGAPGVYVDAAKIAALGLRIRNGKSYHGVALNVSMDLEPYRRINPCGYPGLQVTQLAALGGPSDCALVWREFIPMLCSSLYADLPLTFSHLDQAHSIGSSAAAEVLN